MRAHVSEPIMLETKTGEFSMSHVIVQEANGSPVREGVALRALVQVPASRPLTVRVQSSCLFSESFWATDCDCSLQLQSALQSIASEGGVVLYFYEEGRGAGLATKFEAIRLQRLHNFDTRRAYECLNLMPDARSYSAAAAALKELLGPDRPIRLLSNNREKENGLRREGINVVERVPLICGLDIPDVVQYLKDKKNALGHDTPDTLLGN